MLVLSQDRLMLVANHAVIFRNSFGLDCSDNEDEHVLESLWKCYKDSSRKVIENFIPWFFVHPDIVII